MTVSTPPALTNIWTSLRTKLAPLFHSKLFWSILVIKLVAGSLLASDYLWRLFIPFIEQFASAPLTNPYETFWNMGAVRSFPYPAMMLYIMALPRLLVGWLGFEHWPLFLQMLVYRLPLIVADVAILAVLVRWFRQHTGRVMLLYWAAPALFYISYMHGQLDVIPTALLFVALYWLFSERLIGASILLGLAIAAKTHLVLVLPFFLIYVYRQEWRWAPVLRHAALVAVAFLIPNAPYLFSDGFINMVFHNSEQAKLMAVAVPFTDGTQFYVIAAAYVLLLARSLRITLQNRDVFMMFLGFSFAALTFFITPMPGWYFWIVPFLAYFYSYTGVRHAGLLWGLQALYVLYFAVIPNSDYSEIFQLISPLQATGPNIYAWLLRLHVDANMVVNAVFTLLQTVLLLNCVTIYRRGIDDAAWKKFAGKSFLLGISGDSGSGKTFLAQALVALLGTRNALAICGDDTHKGARGDALWQRMTHLDPKANDLHLELEQLASLRKRRPVSRRIYDHATGEFGAARLLPTPPVVVVEGLHSFYLKPAEAMFDLKIFIDPAAEILLQRKISRDTQTRGYSAEQVQAQVAARAGEAEKYIRAQEAKADMVIRLAAPKSLEYKEESALLSLRIANAIYLDPLLDDMGGLQHSYDPQGFQHVEFAAAPSTAELARLAEKHVPGFAALGIYNPEFASGWTGVLQLIIAYCIFYDAGGQDE